MLPCDLMTEIGSKVLKDSSESFAIAGLLYRKGLLRLWRNIPSVTLYVRDFA